MRVLDAVRASHERRGWVELAAEPVVASRP